jgi:hypothetical protein
LCVCLFASARSGVGCEFQREALTLVSALSLPSATKFAAAIGTNARSSAFLGMALVSAWFHPNASKALKQKARSGMTRSLAMLLLVGLLGSSATAADLGVSPAARSHHHSRHIRAERLPAESHVIEVVAPPYSGQFIINGRNFPAESPACLPWTAGEPVRLLAGDWDGRCANAIIYNVARHRSCPVQCGSLAGY